MRGSGLLAVKDRNISKDFLLILYFIFFIFFTGVWGFPQQAKWTKIAAPLWNTKVHFFLSAYALTVLANRVY